MALYDGIAYACMYNLQGDVIALVNASGTKVGEYKYDAWGKPLSKNRYLGNYIGYAEPVQVSRVCVRGGNGAVLPQEQVL